MTTPGDRAPRERRGACWRSRPSASRACWCSRERPARGAVRWRAPWQPSSIATDVAPPRAAARARSDFAGYDLVVLADVPRTALPDPTLAALERFVRAGRRPAGRGRDAELRPGRLHRHAASSTLLPVRLDIPDKREEATLALALVIDRSGSMAGAKMELTKEAARATAEMLPPADLISVDRLRQPGERRRAAAARLEPAAHPGRHRAHPASGGTNILPGLREAFDQLLPARARKKHVILLSDGQSPYEGIPDLVDDAGAARITVSAVGVGDGADQTLLQMIATRGGGRFYHTRDPASIPRIFSRETSELGDRVDRRAADDGARGRKRASGAGGRAAGDRAGAGRLRRHARRARRPRRSWRPADGEPLLARWQLGLGQVAAWTSDLGARWSAAWTRWPAFDKLWAQLARATMRRRAATHFPIRATRAGDVVRLAIDAVGADDRFLVGLDGGVDVTAVGAGAARRRRARTLAWPRPRRAATRPASAPTSKPARCCSPRRLAAGGTPDRRRRADA